MSRRLGLGVVLGVALLVLVAVPGAVHAQEGGSNPAGYPLQQSLYLTMRDGVRIAVDVWLPEDLQPGQIAQ